MSPRKNIEINITEYLRKQNRNVAFKELYAAFGHFSEQGIRNSMYSLIRRGVVEKVEVPIEGSKVSFKIKKKRTT